jgi:hypothetical protein
MSETWNYFAALSELSHYRDQLIERVAQVKQRVKQKRLDFPGWVIGRRIFSKSNLYEKYQAVGSARREVGKEQYIQSLVNFYTYVKMRELRDVKQRLEYARSKRNSRKGSSILPTDSPAERAKKMREPASLLGLERRFSDLKEEALSMKTRVERSKYDLTLFQAGGWSDAIDLNLV